MYTCIYVCMNTQMGFSYAPPTRDAEKKQLKILIKKDE